MHLKNTAKNQDKKTSGNGGAKFRDAEPFVEKIAWAHARKALHSKDAIKEILGINRAKRKFLLTREQKRELNKKLVEAVEKNDFEGVLSAVAEGAYMHARAENGANIFWKVASHCYRDVAKLLIELGSNINRVDEEKETQMIEASRSPEMLTVLINAGADPFIIRRYFRPAGFWNNEKDELTTKMINGYKERITRGVLEKQKGYAKYRASMITWATLCGLTDVVECMLKIGVSPDIQEKNYRYGALMMASWQGNLQIAGMLLENCANPDLTGKYGQTALSIAVDKGDNMMVQLLLENGADPTINYRKNMKNRFKLNVKTRKMLKTTMTRFFSEQRKEYYKQKRKSMKEAREIAQISKIIERDE